MRRCYPVIRHARPIWTAFPAEEGAMEATVRTPPMFRLLTGASHVEDRVDPRQLRVATLPPTGEARQSPGAEQAHSERPERIEPDPVAKRKAEDVELLARVVGRDQRAVEELYARYSGPLYSLAYQVTRSEGFAQDVVQEVFIALWRDAARFDPSKGAVSPWLFSLARHKAIDLVRREQNVRKRTADVDLELREADDDVDNEAWMGIRRDRVRAALAHLTPLHREAIELAFLDGLTHVEVAERLAIPLGTAKTRIRTALLRLRDILGDSVTELSSAERGAAS
jgi:RNA polymerase sigma-70 factor (ECF subfamily)